MATITADFSSTLGRIKPMHAINNAPMDPGLLHYMGEAGIPFARLHDTGGSYGGMVYVDIENIFRDFDKDPADPASYDFAFTDSLLQDLESQGVKPFYRLGCTIENSQRIRAYHIYPPRDNEKWARICEGIIRHYNEGWADGFHMGIEYWEIWNEPDNEPIIDDNPMWKGTDEQFFRLYETASRHLKSCFPHLKIGGYGSCGFYAALEKASDPNAHVSPRVDYFISFFRKFLAHITSPGHESPLDFFSWHSYGSQQDNAFYARYARDTLNEFGFTRTESIFNEWNPGIQHRGETRDLSNIAGMMLEMQAAPVDMLMYYDGQAFSSYCGLYDPVHRGIFRAYWAFPAFNALYRLGTWCPSASDDPEVMTLAARGEGGRAILLVNRSDRPKDIVLPGSPGSVRVADEGHDFTPASALGPWGVLLAEYGLEACS